MSLPLKPVLRKNPLDPGEAPKYYLQAKARGSITFDELIDQACDGYTVGKDEIRLAVRRVFDKAGDFVDMGFIVQFDEIGHIYLTVRSESSDTEEEATAQKIKDIIPRFKFGKRFREKVRRIKLEKISEKTS